MTVPAESTSVTNTPRMSAPSPARVAALDRLARQAGRFPDLEFVDMGVAPTADGIALDARDVSLARAIEHTVAHRWMTLTAIEKVYPKKSCECLPLCLRLIKKSLKDNLFNFK